MRIAENGVAWLVTSDGQEWRVAWHPPPEAPPGTRHGSAGVCVAGDGVVLVSGDGDRWGLPGGRPEPGEDWADTLRREVREEACATVTGCRLLGFSRGVCVRGSQAGLVLIRALWRAEVRPDPWQPRFEIAQRRLVPVVEAFNSIWIEAGYGPSTAGSSWRPRFPSGRETARPSAGEERVDGFVTGGWRLPGGCAGR